ncbi:MAG: polyphenol oxidase family protein [Actinobacteria bacterium]|nr:polyphenol oxidase family protein [Actinomycetota bacterium]MCI0679330.1 polyphenol oxidase family protein [Actinomycetota bacterium]
MIRPPVGAGAAFSEAGDGDVRNDPTARGGLSRRLGIATEWATLRQVHGAHVVEAVGPGPQGEADAIWTTRNGLPVGVFTADCFGVVLHADDAVGVAHAGWRGARSGVVSRLAAVMSEAGHAPRRAMVGPGIRACCFEVGLEVAEHFPGAQTTTTWGTLSVDLPAVIVTQLGGLDVDVIEGCTRHEDRFFSHRRDGTRQRQTALGWIP